MAHRILWLLGTAVLALVAIGVRGDETVPSRAPDQPTSTTAAGVLSVAEQQALANVAAAYFRGDAASGLAILSPLLAKWDQSIVTAADAALAENGLPPVAQQLAESRLAEIKLRPNDRAPRLSARETVLILPELRKELERVLQTTREHPVMADPLPRAETMEAYEELFWKAHVLDNQLANAGGIARYMTQLAAGLSRREVAKLDDEQRGIAEEDYKSIAEEVASTQRELAERHMEMRADRLAMAKDWLTEPDVSRRKFLAAFAWQLDAGLLEEFYRANQSKKSRSEEPAPRFLRERLNQPDFFRQAGSEAKEAKELAGDLTVKANLLYKGLHWWYRGRYGMGPLMFGLAKHPAAIQSEQGQLGLFMPLTAPKPNDPAAVQGELPQPYYDRRHHYWWAWEDRRVARNGFSETRTKTTTEGEYVGQRLMLTSFW